VANFQHLVTKKKAGESNKGTPENFLNRHISRKKLEVVEFRQCVPLGRQNKQDSKKIY
jgi:hypothetical protein